MSNDCSNNLTITGPITDGVLLALSIATNFAYNPLSIDEEEFDPESSGLPEDLNDPDFAFTGECELELKNDTTLTGWATSDYEPPVDWLGDMSVAFPAIRFEITACEIGMDVAVRAIAFNGELEEFDIPMMEAMLVDGFDADMIAEQMGYCTQEEIAAFVSTYHSNALMPELLAILSDPENDDYDSVEITDDLRAFTIECFNDHGVEIVATH